MINKSIDPRRPSLASGVNTLNELKKQERKGKRAEVHASAPASSSWVTLSCVRLPTSSWGSVDRHLAAHIVVGLRTPAFGCSHHRELYTPAAGCPRHGGALYARGGLATSSWGCLHLRLAGHILIRLQSVAHVIVGLLTPAFGYPHRCWAADACIWLSTLSFGCVHLQLVTRIVVGLPTPALGCLHRRGASHVSVSWRQCVKDG